jgi:hypothetical protein
VRNPDAEVTERVAALPPRVVASPEPCAQRRARSGTIRALVHRSFSGGGLVMRGIGIGLMALGALLVLAAFAPQVKGAGLQYGLTALGPCVGGLGAWLKQEAERRGSRA